MKAVLRLPITLELRSRMNLPLHILGSAGVLSMSSAVMEK